MIACTTTRCINILSSSAKRSGLKIEIDVVDSCHDEVDGNLVPKGLVTTKSKKKQLTLSADVTDLLSILFSIEYIVTFRSTREVLHLSLFITMAVNSCGRICEIVQSSNPHSVATKYLRREHVRIFAFTEGDSEIVLRGLIRFDNSKNRKPDPSKVKTIPLRLLPLLQPWKILYVN